MRFRLEEYDSAHDVALHEIDRADADLIAEHCKAASNDGQIGSGDMKHAMRVDGWFILDWCNKKGVTWSQFFHDTKLQTLFLEDPNLSVFRIWKGAL